MSFTYKVIEAIINDDKCLNMTVDDILKATIQEVLLYYTYTIIMDKEWFPELHEISNYIDDNGKITFDENCDVMLTAFYLTNEPTGYNFIYDMSEEAKEEIIEYSKKYNILSNRNIISLIHKLKIDNDDIKNYIKKDILKTHLSNTKSARN